MSRYDADTTYCYPESAVLCNKGGFTDQALLDNFEADFSSIRIIEISQNPVQGEFDLSHLQKIHFNIFQDVYDWAGEIRSVDISRNGSRFCNVRQIIPYSTKIFTSLAQENFLRGLAHEKAALRLAHYLSEVNAIHPFREGNDRTQRVYISQLAEQAGYSLAYSELEQTEVYEVMELSFHGDKNPLAKLIMKIMAKI